MGKTISWIGWRVGTEVMAAMPKEELLGRREKIRKMAELLGEHLRYLPEEESKAMRTEVLREIYRTEFLKAMSAAG